MSTLHDLRATLGAHAPADDAALHHRAAAVRSRVAVVRRRRRVATAVGAVAAVAVVVAGIALPRLVVSNGRADLAAATSLATGGFRYELVKIFEMQPGKDDLRLTLPRSTRRQVVVLLAEGLDGGSVTLSEVPSGEPIDDLETGTPVDRLYTDGAGVPVPASAADASYLLHTDATGPKVRVGIALYRRTEAMPEGVVDPTGATVFRREAGGRRLLAAAFIRPGQAEATLRFSGALADVRLSDFCSTPRGGTPADGPWFHVSIDGDGAVSGSCGAPQEDASLGGSFFPDSHVAADHTARVWITPTEHGDPAPVAGAVAGLGVYSPGEGVLVHGSTIDRVVESQGRVWQLADIVRSTPGERRIEATWTGLRDHLLVGYAVEGTQRVSTGGTVPGGGHVDMTAKSAAEARSSAVGGVVLPADEASFDVTWPARFADASGAILVYRPLD